MGSYLSRCSQNATLGTKISTGLSEEALFFFDQGLNSLGGGFSEVESADSIGLFDKEFLLN